MEDIIIIIIGLLSLLLLAAKEFSFTFKKKTYFYSPDSPLTAIKVGYGLQNITYFWRIKCVYKLL